MSRIDVLAGDFLHGEASYQNGCIHIETVLHRWPGINLSAGKIHRLFMVDDESWVMVVPRHKSRLLPSNKISCGGIMFMILFKDGRILLGSTDYTTLRRIVYSSEFQAGGGER